MNSISRAVDRRVADRIFLRGIEVMACHGVHDEERTRAQLFVIDVDLWLDAESCALADDYGRAVCYKDVFDAVVEIATGRSMFLIEALAQAIADALLARHRRLGAARITVHKPGAPLGGAFADVGVTLTRQRRPR